MWLDYASFCISLFVCAALKPDRHMADSNPGLTKLPVVILLGLNHLCPMYAARRTRSRTKLCGQFEDIKYAYLMYLKLIGYCHYK